ncbi:MAG: hypothetical protein YFSK_5010 [Candidatus Yanofskyibacterium parasiticum]|nr:MAG: hypothetical protein YFSK_5010 [Candidatus Yanofskybacteria bacterium]
MKLILNPWFAATVIFVCIVAFASIFNSNGSFGQFIFRHFPCDEDPNNSVSCSFNYDIIAMVIVGSVGLIFTGILVFDLIKIFKK